MGWTFRVGFSQNELDEVLSEGQSRDNFEDVFVKLKQCGIEIEKVVPKEIIISHIAETRDADYKNVSLMRVDAPLAFSCSSLISYLYTFAGIWMPSISVDKYVFGTPITKDELMFGDLVFANSREGRIYYETIEWNNGTPVPEGIDHVGMYLGENKVLHASRTVSGVAIEDLDESASFKGKVVGYRRIANLDEVRYVAAIRDNASPYQSKDALLSLIALLISHAPITVVRQEVPYFSQLTDVGGDFWPSRACGAVALAKALASFGKYTEGKEGLHAFCEDGHEKGAYVFPLGWFREKLACIAEDNGVTAISMHNVTLQHLADEISSGARALISIEKKILGRKRTHIVLAVGVVLGKMGTPLHLVVHDPESLSEESGAYQLVSAEDFENDWTGSVVILKG